MGQDVIIKDTATIGDVLMIDTDRSFTGQDGHALTVDSHRHGVPGMLADRLFSADSNIDYIFVLQNSVTVRRQGGWDEEAAATVTDITGSFLRYYPDEDQSVDEAPYPDEDQSVDEAPVADEEQSVDEAPVADEEQSVDEAPVADEDE